MGWWRRWGSWGGENNLLVPGSQIISSLTWVKIGAPIYRSQWGTADIQRSVTETSHWIVPFTFRILVTPWHDHIPIQRICNYTCYDMSLMPSIILIAHGSVGGITQAIEMRRRIYCVLRLHEEHDKWSVKPRQDVCQKWALMGLRCDKRVFEKTSITRVWESNYLWWCLGLGLCKGDHNYLQRNVDEYGVKEARTWS